MLKSEVMLICSGISGPYGFVEAREGLNQLFLHDYDHLPIGMAFSINEKQYHTVGGWDDALNRHADAVWQTLPDDRKKLTKRVFQRLT